MRTSLRGVFRSALLRPELPILEAREEFGKALSELQTLVRQKLAAP
jgi:hypothetical protein